MKVRPSYIACTGISGLLIASNVSYKTGIPLVIVRNGTTSKHAQTKVETVVPLDGDYAIIDDLVCSGETVAGIVDALPGTCKWLYLWNASHIDGGNVPDERFRNQFSTISIIEL
jgi:adenine/guanine phosphoribosyltransferase-like PRPP-binding protein